MTTREKRKEKITRVRQKQILDAALAVFSSKGFGESTVADIAKEASIGVGTIYNYYKDKHDLLISLIADSLMSEELVRILATQPARNNEKFMQSLMEERLSFGLDNAQKMMFLFFEIQRDPRLRRPYVAKIVGPLLNRLEQYIAAQIDNGSFRKMDARIVARTVAGAFIGNMILYRLEQRESPFKKSQVKSLAEELTNLFIHGMSVK
jgi:AcrR family transcriptional regulator